MSTKVPTEVKCHDNSTKKTTIDIKCQKLTPKVPLQAKCQCKIARPESRCSSVKNPWIARIGATFAVSAVLVIYGALYSRLGERMEARDKTMTEIENLINGLQERIEGLEAQRCSFLGGNKKCPNGPAANKDGTVGSPSIASVGVVGSPSTDGPVNRPLVGRPGRKTPSPTISRENVRAGTRKKKKSNQKKRESVYIHWGGDACRSGAKEVYRGHVASTNSIAKYQGGGGTNYLCMPSHPKYHGHDASSNDDRAYLYPVKFGEVADVLVSSRVRTRLLDYHGVSCIVCRVQRSLQMMVPGTYLCPVGWKNEYRGYLMAQGRRRTIATTEYICVDADSIGMSNTTATGQDKGHAFLSLVEHKCPDQTCGSYNSHVNDELACSVCSAQ